MLRVQAVRRVRRADLVLACSVGLAAAVTAAAWSWVPSLWGDEAASITSASRSWSSLATMLGHVDAVHGLYYAGLHLWVDVFGASPFSVRLPSALADGVTAAVVVLLCLRLRERRIAVVAGLLCVALPRLTYAGEEARSYAFTAAIAALLTLMFAVLLEPGRHRGLWVAYVALFTLGVYLFCYLGLLALGHAATLALRGAGRRLVLRWLVAIAVVAVLCVPIGVIAWLQRAQISYLAVYQALDANTVLVDGWFFTPAFAIAAWLTLVVGAVVAVSRGAGVRRDDAFTLFAPWLLVPSAVLIGSSVFVSDYTARYLTFCAPAAAAMLGWALVRITAALPERWGMRMLPVTAATAAFVALAVPAYLGQRGPYAKNDSDWAELSAAVGAHASRGDAVVFDETYRPSRRPRLAMHTYPAGFAGLKDVTLRTPYQQRNTWYDSVYTVAQVADRFAGVHRVWLVEYSLDGVTDRWGERDLAALGFTRVQSIPLHTSVVEQWVHN